jgi:MYXO-CTERM domain-containing protein
VLFNRPFDSNVYFQGSRDFAYDGDVTRHEFTHALVHSFVPGLASLGRDAFGSHAESGGLNEGWADYFSSSFANDPAVGDYAAQGLVAGELGLRNNDNDFRCPDNVIGQVHNDSEHWAGALWAIREEHRGGGGDVNLLDRALLEALAQADNDEDMTRAASRAEGAIRTAFGDALADFARAEFEARGVSACLRVWPLAVVDAEGTGITVTRKDVLAQPGIADVGVANFAPSVLQFRVDVPAGSAGFTLKWQQAAGGGGLGGGGGGEAPMAVAVAEVPVDNASAHIEWRYEGANGNLAVPYFNDGALDFNETTAAVTLGAADNNGVQAASFTQTLTSDPCAARSFVASIVALDGGAQLQNIDVDNIGTDAACPSDDDSDGDGDGDGVVEGCACNGTSRSSASLGLIGLALLGLRRRRR